MKKGGHGSRGTAAVCLSSFLAFVTLLRVVMAVPRSAILSEPPEAFEDKLPTDNTDHLKCCETDYTDLPTSFRGIA